MTENDTKLPTLDEHNIFLFTEDFERKTVRPVIEFILRKNLLPDHLRPDHLTLVINSPGGEVDAAFALIDIMKGSAIPVHTVGLGQIGSCGLLVFISGHKGSRLITPMTSILSHQYSWGSMGKEHELLSRVKEFELTSQRIMRVYKHCTGLSETKIREVLLPAQDVWLSADEAIQHGLADSIKSTF
jgi:ATP-dependent Clp protease, protease subunit